MATIKIAEDQAMVNVAFRVEKRKEQFGDEHVRKECPKLKWTAMAWERFEAVLPS